MFVWFLWSACVSCCRVFGLAPPPSMVYTLSLHDALPISLERSLANAVQFGIGVAGPTHMICCAPLGRPVLSSAEDRKSTRLNSSHLGISYAVFCLKKKTTIHTPKNPLRRTGTSRDTRPVR